MTTRPLPSGAEFRPTFPKAPSRSLLVDQVASFYGLPVDQVNEWYKTYLRFHRKMKYRRRLGEKKTLCFSEAFVLFAGMSVVRPRQILEIGTQHGKSTRRILDMRDLLGLESSVTCYDLEDLVEHFGKHEAELKLEDLTGQFREKVIEPGPPELIYLDAHPWSLLKEVIGDLVKAAPQSVLTIHDCGRGLCNPEMIIDKQDPEITSHTGVWERYVLAEQFGVEDPLSQRLDAIESDTHRLRVFPTPHGLAAMAPLELVAASP